MTYCVGGLVREGLAMLADTRTKAGVDNVSTYRKLRIFGNDGHRLVAVRSAGQAVRDARASIPKPPYA